MPQPDILSALLQRGLSLSDAYPWQESERQRQELTARAMMSNFSPRFIGSDSGVPTSQAQRFDMAGSHQNLGPIASHQPVSIAEAKAVLKANRAAEDTAIVSAAERQKKADATTPDPTMPPLRSLEPGRSFLSQAPLSPVDALLQFQSQVAPAPQIQTSFDGQGGATIKTDEATLGNVMNMLRHYQEITMGLDQQMAQRDADLAAKERAAKANPLLHALGLLSANIAQQPNMPGIVRALGATAADLHKENDPNVIEAQRRQLIQDRLNLSQNASNQAFVQERFAETMDQKKQELQQKKFNQAVRNLKNVGYQTPEYFKNQGFPEDIANQLSDATKQHQEAKKFEQDLQTQKAQVDKQFKEDRASHWDAMESIARARQEAISARDNARSGRNPELDRARIVQIQSRIIDPKIRDAQKRIDNYEQQIAGLSATVLRTTQERAKYEQVANDEGVKRMDQYLFEYRAKVESLERMKEEVKRELDGLRNLRETSIPPLASIAPGAQAPTAQAAPAQGQAQPFVAPVGVRITTTKK